MTDSEFPVDRSKVDLEKLVKSYGGNIFQSVSAREKMVVIADKGDSLQFNGC
jgi:hypothetical protein